MVECRRSVVWDDKVEEIVVNHHSYAYSGIIPCTGAFRCIYCGKHYDAKDFSDGDTMLNIEWQKGEDV